jgi:hypothetical protein
MKAFVSNYVLPLALVITLSIGGLFVQVSGIEYRTGVLEEELASIDLLVRNQERILFKLCLLIDNSANC